jgi:hypothetical protein
MPRFNSSAGMRYTSGASDGGGSNVENRQVDTLVIRSCCAMYEAIACAPGSGKRLRRAAHRVVAKVDGGLLRIVLEAPTGVVQSVLIACERERDQAVDHRQERNAARRERVRVGRLDDAAGVEHHRAVLRRGLQLAVDELAAYAERVKRGAPPVLARCPVAACFEAQ